MPGREKAAGKGAAAASASAAAGRSHTHTPKAGAAGAAGAAAVKAEESASAAKSKARPPTCETCNGRKGEQLICADCNRSWHLSCLDYSAKLIQGILQSSTPWRCTECKLCYKCGKKTHQSKILICDNCDAGQHMFCSSPPLDSVPPGRFSCDACRGNHALRSQRRGAPPSSAPAAASAAATPRAATSSPAPQKSKRARTGSQDGASEEDAPAHPPVEVRAIQQVAIGDNLITTWHNSAYPESFRVPTLYICKFCFCYFKCELSLTRHAQRCPLHHPPGTEIYRKGDLSFWEVDGGKEPIYCQNVCLFAKLFLDHKTLHFDVEPFWFYVLTEWTADGAQMLGYFSKEKDSPQNHNLSCILTIPKHQQTGYGKMMIDFSYLLSKQEKVVGSPETPLSDLGLLSYRSYWSDAILDCLVSNNAKELSLREISEETAIAPTDVVNTLQAKGIIKYWRGKHVLTLDKDMLTAWKERSRKWKRVDPQCLRWTPPAARADAASDASSKSSSA
eukprot:m.180082 g.180082  ORF g.180082 m.180082 type:complete len:505 (-) comp17421_c0_seq4:1523-3037(-)